MRAPSVSRVSGLGSRVCVSYHFLRTTQRNPRQPRLTERRRRVECVSGRSLFRPSMADGVSHSNRSSWACWWHRPPPHGSCRWLRLASSSHGVPSRSSRPTSCAEDGSHGSASLLPSLCSTADWRSPVRSARSSPPKDRSGFRFWSRSRSLWSHCAPMHKARTEP